MLKIIKLKKKNKGEKERGKKQTNERIGVEKRDNVISPSSFEDIRSELFFFLIGIPIILRSLLN